MVHETLETAHNVITLFYELGIKHLKLLPYAPGHDVPSDVTAITCSHPNLVPDGILRVNDLGPRPLDPQTILDVMSRLDLMTEEGNVRLQGWMGQTMARSHALIATITWLGEMKQQMEAVLDVSGDGMVACDASGRVTLFNARAEELLGVRAADVAGRQVGHVLPQLRLHEVLAGRSIGISGWIHRTVNRDLRGMPLPYIEAIEQAGGVPLLLPPGVARATLDYWLPLLDGPFLPGGLDIDPARYGEERYDLCDIPNVERDDHELELARWALDQKVPLLGICRGAQVVAVAEGGTLWRDIEHDLGTGIRHRQPERRTEAVHQLQVLSGTLLERTTERCHLSVTRCIIRPSGSFRPCFGLLPSRRMASSRPCTTRITRFACACNGTLRSCVRMIPCRRRFFRRSWG